MALITAEQLENASEDSISLDEFINGAEDLNGTGLVTTRTGQTYKTVKNIESSTILNLNETVSEQVTTLSAIALESSAISVTQAGIATTKATEAAASAAAASAIVLNVATGQPLIRPSLLLDFANSKSLDPRITFARSTTASYYNSRGLLAYAKVNEPCIDHDTDTGECKGVAIWEGRTNLLSYSEDFSNAVWMKNRASILKNSVAAQDGTLTASKLIESTESGVHTIKSTSITPVASTLYSASIYIKSSERTEVQLNLEGGGATSYGLKVNLTTGEKLSDTLGLGKVKILNDGWVRVSIEGFLTVSTATLALNLYLSNTGALSYTGDGVSGLYIWGAQLEVGAFLTPYIPSTQTFTSRSTTGMYYGSDGFLKSAAIDAARMQYNPNDLTLAPKLLLENASTNLLAYSEDFGSAAWIPSNNLTTAPNTTTAPDGSTTADTITLPNLGARVFQLVGGVVPETIYTFSYWVKLITSTSVEFAIYGTVDSSLVLIIGDTAVENLSTAWKRVSASFVAPTGCTALRIYLLRTAVADSVGSVAIWGAQLEEGPLTSYIPTTSAAVTRAADISSSAAATRAADVLTMTGTNFSDWYRQDEGTIVAKFISVPANGGYSFSISDGTSLNTITQYLGSGVLSGLSVGGVSQLPSIISGDAKNNTLSAIAYKVNDTAITVDGLPVNIDTSCLIPNVNKLSIGTRYSNSGAFLNGHIANIAYFPKRVSNTELQVITQQ